jgi:hypothetical protein
MPRKRRSIEEQMLEELGQIEGRITVLKNRRDWLVTALTEAKVPIPEQHKPADAKAKAPRAKRRA